MEHLGTQIIETERLILRPFVLEDARAMYDNWASDPEVTKYLTWPAYTSVEIADAVLTNWTANYEKPDFYQWAIVPRETGKPVGSISVVEMNERVDWVELGYCIGRSWWHQGIMSESLSAVIDYLFDKVGVNRIQARHDPRNPHSGDVMKKCGMKYEGTLRQYGRNNQGVCDANYYALLKSER